MRNKTLDIAKGIAMISIILGHLSVWRINCVVFITFLKLLSENSC